MSSGFVSAGTSNPGDENDPWAAARAAVEAAKKPREEEHQDERSLYEILQANKAKKQEAFEESLKFKHQFKPLDEEDVEYLDSIIDTERRVEALRKRELENQLDDFRRHQSEVEKVVPDAADLNEFGNWSAGRKKRKKEQADDEGKRKGLGLKLRKTSTGASNSVADEKEKTSTTGKDEDRKPENVAAKSTLVEKGTPVKETPSKVVPAPNPAPALKQAPAKPAGGLAGLVAYGSDDEDD
ncbi:hypothetical protein RUND412_011045 [Rhizina undulata]